MDDYSYMFNFVTKARINSLADIVESLTIHYTNVNGRMVTHFLAHLFLWLGKSIFVIINTAAFFGLCAVMSRLICNRFSFSWIFVTASGFFLLTPRFGECFLWVTGAANYLYSILIVLTYLLGVSKLFTSNNVKSSLPASIFSLIFGIIAGATLENVSAALCCCLVLILLFRIIRRINLPAQLFCGIFGSIAGLLSVILAPGQVRRLENVAGEQSFDEILARFEPISDKFLELFAPILILDAVLALSFILKNGLKAFERLIPAVVFFVTTLASVYSMVASPQFPERVWVGPLCFLLVTTGILVDLLDIKTGTLVSIVTILALGIAVAVAFYGGITALNETRTACVERDASAREQIAAGSRDLVLEAVVGSGNRFDPQPEYPDILPDASCWTNVALARYYAVDTVVSE